MPDIKLLPKTFFKKNPLSMSTYSLPVPVRSKPVIVHKTMVDTVSPILYNIL